MQNRPARMLSGWGSFCFWKNMVLCKKRQKDVLNVEYEEKIPAPLDNDALTRLIYLHDDEITQLLVRIRQLEERVRMLEEEKS